MTNEKVQNKVDNPMTKEKVQNKVHFILYFFFGHWIACPLFCTFSLAIGLSTLFCTFSLAIGLSVLYFMLFL
jgi:hypothetical protein